MTMQDLRAIAKYHAAEAAKCERTASGVERNHGGIAHGKMIRHWRNQERFHQDAAAKLEQLTAAFETFANLTTES